MTSETSTFSEEEPLPRSQAKKHAVITIEPLLEEKALAAGTSKKSGNLCPTFTQPAGPSAELQRQQRRRLFVHLLVWLLLAVMIIVAGVLVYFVIISGSGK